MFQSSTTLFYFKVMWVHTVPLLFQSVFYKTLVHCHNPTKENSKYLKLITKRKQKNNLSFSAVWHYQIFGGQCCWKLFLQSGIIYQTKLSLCLCPFTLYCHFSERDFKTIRYKLPKNRWCPEVLCVTSNTFSASQDRRPVSL